MKRNGLWTLALASLLVVALCGCGMFDKSKGDKDKDSSSQTEQRESDPGYPVSAGGITLEHRPDTVVSLSPSLTEKLYDLGMEDVLIGVSDYCDFPTEVVALPVCGTAQLPDLNRLAEIKPDLVVTEAQLPPAALTALEELGIPVATLPRAGTVEQLMDTYLTLARLIDGDSKGYETGDRVVGEYRTRLKALSNSLTSYAEENGRKKVLYLRLMDYTVATGDTFEGKLMEAIGLDNVAGYYSDWKYPESDRDGLIGVDIIYMDDSAVTIKDLEQSPIYKGLQATIKDRYFYISSLELERQSFRTLDTLEAMAAYAYPEAKIQTASRDIAPPDDFDDDEGMQDE